MVFSDTTWVSLEDRASMPGAKIFCALSAKTLALNQRIVLRDATAPISYNSNIRTTLPVHHPRGAVLRHQLTSSHSYATEFGESIACGTAFLISNFLQK
jgi:hypothetical protein